MSEAFPERKCHWPVTSETERPADCERAHLRLKGFRVTGRPAVPDRYEVPGHIIYP